MFRFSFWEETPTPIVTNILIYIFYFIKLKITQSSFFYRSKSTGFPKINDRARYRN
jgi:hypothetical protein